MRQDHRGHTEHFAEHGWVLIQGLLRRDEVEAALPGLFTLYPTAEQFFSGEDARSLAFTSGRTDADQGTEGRFRPLQFVGLREFPFRDQTLNSLAVHPAIIAAAEDLLGTNDIRLYQAETFAKYSGVTSYEQPFHVDYTNHTMLPPRSDVLYRQVQMFLYLCDVTPALGPTRIVSRTLTRHVPLTHLAFPRGTKPDVDDELLTTWEAASVCACAPIGSLLVYAADVAHRGTDMTQPNGARFFFNLAYRAAGADWVGGNPWPRKGMQHWTELVERCTPRQLAVLGFPPPGHDYWNTETLAGAAERYPNLDLTPFRRASITSPR